MPPLTWFSQSTLNTRKPCSSPQNKQRHKQPRMAPIQPFKPASSPVDEAQHNCYFDITSSAGDLQPWAAERRLYNRVTGFAMDEMPCHSIPFPSENRHLPTSTSSSRRAPAIMRHISSVGSESRQAGSPDSAVIQENAVEDSASVASTAPRRRRASVY